MTIPYRRVVSIEGAELQSFKLATANHGIPDSVASVSFGYLPSGECVEMGAMDSSGEEVFVDDFFDASESALAQLETIATNRLDKLAPATLAQAALPLANC